MNNLEIFLFCVVHEEKNKKNCVPQALRDMAKFPKAVLKLLRSHLRESENFIWSMNYLNGPFNYIPSPRK